MKFFLLFLGLIAVVFGEDTAHLKVVKECEKSNGLSEETIQELWAWKIPEGLEKCHMNCIFKGSNFNWVSGSEINYSVIDNDFSNIKHTTDSKAFVEENCGTLPSDECERSNELYKCFLDKFEPLQKFKDAFDQIEDTI